MFSKVYHNFTSTMVKYFPNGIAQNGADLSQRLDDRLKHFDDGTLGEALTWFIDNRTSQTFPSIAECLARCTEIKKNNIARADAQQLKAQKQLEEQEPEHDQEFPEEDREYVSIGLSLLATCLRAKRDEEKEALYLKIKKRSSDFWGDFENA